MKNLLSRLIAAAFLALLLSVDSYAAQVALSWRDNSDNETSFEVERRRHGTFDLTKTPALTVITPAEPYGTVAVLGADVQSYVDTSVVVNTVYCYRVRAVNSAGSAASPDGCMIVQPANVVITFTP